MRPPHAAERIHASRESVEGGGPASLHLQHSGKGLAAMTTTTTGLILALDLGKYKGVACLQGRAGSPPRFEALTTSRHGLRALLQRHRPGVVGFEACTLAGWVSGLCEELGVPCKVANTASEAWKFKHTKRKADRDDALRLASLEVLAHLPTAR